MKVLIDVSTAVLSSLYRDAKFLVAVRIQWKDRKAMDNPFATVGDSREAHLPKRTWKTVITAFGQAIVGEREVSLTDEERAALDKAEAARKGGQSGVTMTREEIAATFIAPLEAAHEERLRGLLTKPSL